MILISNPDKSQWQEILKRPVMNTENLFDTVRSVIDRVKEEGDRAVLDYEEKFDKVFDWQSRTLRLSTRHNALRARKCRLGRG